MYSKNVKNYISVALLMVASVSASNNGIPSSSSSEVVNNRPPVFDVASLIGKAINKRIAGVSQEDVEGYIQGEVEKLSPTTVAIIVDVIKSVQETNMRGQEVTRNQYVAELAEWRQRDDLRQKELNSIATSLHGLLKLQEQKNAKAIKKGWLS